MNIILLGKPGSGKGTQAQFITKKYKIPHISTGNILRNEIKKNTNIGFIVKSIIKQGKLVDDKLIIKLIKKRINQKDCKYGYLLDGFPRTVKQARYMIKKNIKIDIIIEIFINNKISIDRLSGRMIHIKSGRIYHKKYKPPKNNMYDDITGEYLETRIDDKKETIKKRLKDFNKNNSILLDFFHVESINNKIKYFKIDGNNSILNINKKIINIFNKYLNNKY